MEPTTRIVFGMSPEPRVRNVPGPHSRVDGRGATSINVVVIEGAERSLRGGRCVDVIVGGGLWYGAG
ncbi:hypothetical protein GCM10010532_063190 [Dactylosporangium siamense]